MANNYKGIELEIGGNTTGLKKALNGIDKEINSTQKELNEVNRLLKFDPTNTELLAQKQKLLSNQFNDTQKRVEALKSAKETADTAMRQGTEINEKQYRALQREIIKTENSVAAVSKETEELNDKLKNLNSKDNLFKKIKSSFDGLKNKISDTKKHLSESFSNSKVGKIFTPLTNGVKKVTSGFSKMGSAVASGLKVAGTGAVQAGKVIATGVAGIGAALVGAAESTREYREDMNRLSVAFTSAGKTTESAQGIYSKFYAVLGESDRSVEAVSHLAQLCKSEEELALWGDICAGVSAKFGDSLPIEGLTEAANETAKVGKVTGPLADALNWVGISEDKFNEKLAKCGNEQERSTLITQTLAKAYNEASWQFKEANGAIMAAREAQAQLDSSMALLGQTAEGVVAPLKAVASEGLASIATGLSQIMSGDTQTGLETITEGVNQFVENAITQINELTKIAEPILTALADAIIQNLPMLIDAAMQIITMLATFIMNNIDKISATAVDIVLQLASALIASIPELIPAVFKIVGAINNAILEKLPEILALGKKLAVNLIKGLTGGITEGVKNVVGACGKVVSGITNFFTGKFEIHSPSKWSERIGRFLMQGLAEGIKKDMSAEDALEKKISNLKKFISSELGLNESDISLAEAEFNLWELQNPNASEETKYNRQIGMLVTKITKQTEAVQITNDALFESVKLTGENSEESKAYQLQLVNERIELEKLKKEMEEVLEARKNLYNVSDETNTSTTFKLTNHTNPISYMRQNNTVRTAGQKEGQTINNVTQNYYGYKGTVSENNAALKKTLKNAEVALA